MKTLLALTTAAAGLPAGAAAWAQNGDTMDDPKDMSAEMAQHHKMMMQHMAMMQTMMDMMKQRMPPASGMQ